MIWLLMPAFTFNPHRHVKIWISKEPGSFLNFENQLRMIRMRETNLNDVIHFVYDIRLLSPDAVTQLHIFCEKYQLIPVDINIILPLCTSMLELKLITMYHDEILNLDKGGNPAVASDILRLLSPVYTRGNYTDFDVVVDTRTLPENIHVNAPILIRISSYIPKEDSTIVRFSVNNDTWCVVDPIQALPYIQKIQTIAIQLSGVQSTSIPPNQHPYRRLSDFTGSLLTLLSEQQSARQMRHSISRLCKSNSVLYRLMLDLDNFVIDGERLFFKKQSFTMTDDRLNQIATELRIIMSAKLSSSTPGRRRVIEHYLKGSDQSILDINRQEIHDQLLEYTVIGTTGPDAYMLGLFGRNQFPRQTMEERVCPLALETYGLQLNFYSTNGYPMGSREADKNICLDACTNDNSWKLQGERDSRSRLDNMRKAASSIQQFFRARCYKESHVADRTNSCAPCP